MEPTARPDTTLAVVAHLSALVWLVGIPGVVGPLIVWLVKRDDPHVEPHARAALNFHLAMFLYGVAGVVVAIALVLTIVGILFIPFLVILGLAIWLWSVIATIIGAVRANEGVVYHYPLTLNLISPPPV